MNRFHTILTMLLLTAAPSLASAHSSTMPDMSGMNHQRGMTMPMPGMSMMGMASSVDLNDPMSREASGTAWMPDSSPMYGKMTMKPNGDMLMLHGAIMPRYINVGSKRGDRRFDAPNWFMGMYGHPLDAKSQIGLRAMLSLDPITEGGYGYPLLFQTGETWHHQPLHDRQHPHDLFDELAATYSHLLGGGNSAYVYLGYPGEPALGPPTYMHRLLAYDYPDAPIGHHWQDATHITFGVATVGVNWGGKVKLEASDFTGREPDENRYNFDKPRFDSYSGRISYNPNADNAYQVSYGFIQNPEGDGIPQHRITASWLYNKPLGSDSNFTSALTFGQNNLPTEGRSNPTEGRSNSFLAEADYQHGSDTVFGRVENIQKSGQELVLTGNLSDRKYTLGAYTAGIVHDLSHGNGIDTGIGLALTLDTKPSALDAIYGSGSPVSLEIYLRLRPSRLQMADGKMAEAAPPAGPAAAQDLTVTASLSPNPPTARANQSLTITLSEPDGKPVTGAKIQVDVAMTSMDMGTAHPAIEETGSGRYLGSVAFAMRGHWRITLRITPPGGGTMVVKTVDYNVAP